MCLGRPSKQKTAVKRFHREHSETSITNGLDTWTASECDVRCRRLALQESKLFAVVTDPQYQA